MTFNAPPTEGKIIDPEAVNIESVLELTTDKIITKTDPKTEEKEDLPYISPRRLKARALAQSRGFEDEYQMEGWLHFNRLANESYSQDVDVLHSNSNGCMNSSHYD